MQGNKQNSLLPISKSGSEPMEHDTDDQQEPRPLPGQIDIYGDVVGGESCR